MFLNSWCKIRGRIQVFNKCDLLTWYICCFFLKHSGRATIIILTTFAQRERRNSWRTSGIESTKASSFSLYLMPDPTLINQSSKEWINWEQSSNDGGIIFPKHSIVHWIMVVVRGFILVDTYLRVFCSRPVLNVPEFWVLRSPICSVTSRLPNLIHT